MSEVFEQVCPTYIAYGMSWRQFWFGDPWMAKAYRDAFLLKRKMRNEDLWLQGLYNFNAFQATIATAFGKKRESYIEKPLDVFPKTKAEKEREKAETRSKLIQFLNAMIRADRSNKGVDKDGKP